jgi:uncharacterized protein (DUF488 family)
VTGEQLLPLPTVEGDPAMIVTSRYQAWLPEHGIPVRTTVGNPRFWRGPKLVYLSEIAPYGVFKNPDLVTREEKIEAYEARLNRNAGRIIERLDRLVTEHPGQRIVLLCYENVLAGEECHRRWFASWFKELTHVDVPELGA